MLCFDTLLRGLGTHTPGGVPGTGCRYTIFCAYQFYVDLYLFHTWLRSGRAAPTFFIAKKVGKEALKGEPASIYKYMEAIKFALPQTCPKRQGRGIFPLENPSPVFLGELLDNTKGFIT